MSEVIRSKIGNAQVAALSGATHAEEDAKNLPTKYMSRLKTTVSL